MPKFRAVALLSAVLSFAVACLWTCDVRAEERRPLPDYDGRGERPPTTGEVLLWVPRILLAPPYLVSEYLVRRPLGFVIAGAERAGVPAFLYDFFTFGSEHQAGIIPTAYVDFDFYPSIGLYAFWDGAGLKGHDLRLRAATGGSEWLAGSVAERLRFTRDPADQIALEASGEHRPDYTFFGLGPESRQSNLVRYGQDTREVRGLISKRLWRASFLHAGLALRRVEFRRGGYGGDPVLEDAIGSGKFPPPPGYEQGYELLRSSLAAVFDDRLPRPAPGSGIRVAAQASHSGSVRSAGSFVTYGATVGGFWDLNDRARVLSLSVGARFADPIAGATIPFTELVTLGGQEPMRGLYPGRLIDRSGAVAALAYRWPVWIWLDGALRAELGNVFGEHLAGFSWSRLRWSGSIGVESNGSPDSAFQIAFGLGSETFESGAKVNSFRLAAGTTHGF